MSKSTYSKANLAAFLKSDQWLGLRYRTLVTYPYCCLCMTTVQHGSRLTANHIVHPSKDWSKRADFDNLQTLCVDCDEGKGIVFTDDWR